MTPVQQCIEAAMADQRAEPGDQPPPLTEQVADLATRVRAIEEVVALETPAEAEEDPKP